MARKKSLVPCRAAVARNSLHPRLKFWTDFKFNVSKRNLCLSACLMRGLKAVRCDFLGENRLGAGPVKIELSSLVYLLYAQVNVRRETLQIAKIRRFQQQERQYTTFQAACAVSVTKSNTSNQVTPQPNQTPSGTTKCQNVHFNNYYSGPDKEIKAQLLRIENQLVDVQKKIDSLTEKSGPKKSVKKNCAEMYKSGKKISGVYTIDPDGSGAFDVFCDQTSAGGGWTVIQKRLDGSVDFIRGWNEYKRGFGNLNGEFWLGLDKIHRLTKTKSRLRVELEDMKGNSAYAGYDFFAVSSERAKYKLSLGTYYGTAGDSLSYHRGSAFSTKDRDNDNYSGNCAARYKGAAWWFNSCVSANLNGHYYHGHHSNPWSGIDWEKWKGHSYSAKRSEMKIRPVDF